VVPALTGAEHQWRWHKGLGFAMLKCHYDNPTDG
jgi:hypothetical protein